MPIWLPKLQGTYHQDDTASMQGVTTCVAGSANVKGAWVQAIAATTYECNMLSLQGRFQNPRGQFILDVAIGAGGSEVVILKDLAIGRDIDFNAMNKIQIPIRIPKGVRVACRVQSDTAAAQLSFGVVVTLEAGIPCGQYAHCEGADLSTSLGPLITADEVWTEITPGLVYDYKYIVFFVTDGGQTWSADANPLIEWGIGPSGSEVSFMQHYTRQEDNLGASMPAMAPICVNTFPKGARITGKQTSGNNVVNLQIVGVI